MSDLGNISLNGRVRGGWVGDFAAGCNDRHELHGDRELVRKSRIHEPLPLARPVLELDLSLAAAPLAAGAAPCARRASRHETMCRPGCCHFRLLGRTRKDEHGQELIEATGKGRGAAASQREGGSECAENLR